MKFRNYLESIQGVDIYPLIGLLLSFGIFILIIIWVWKLDKSKVDSMKNIPFDIDNQETLN